MTAHGSGSACQGSFSPGSNRRVRIDARSDAATGVRRAGILGAQSHGVRAAAETDEQRPRRHSQEQTRRRPTPKNADPRQRVVTLTASCAGEGR
jgi:hypothetical protein